MDSEKWKKKKTLIRTFNRNKRSYYSLGMLYKLIENKYKLNRFSVYGVKKKKKITSY